MNVSLLESAKKEREIFKLRLIFVTKDFSESIAEMTSQEKIAFLKDMGFESSIADDLLEPILYGVFKSFAYEWSDKENAFEFISYLHSLRPMIDIDFTRWKNRVNLPDENVEFVFNLLDKIACLNYETEWIELFLCLLSDAQMASLNQRMTEGVTSSSNFIKAMILKTGVDPLAEVDKAKDLVVESLY